MVLGRHRVGWTYIDRVWTTQTYQLWSEGVSRVLTWSSTPPSLPSGIEIPHFVSRKYRQAERRRSADSRPQVHWGTRRPQFNYTINVETCLFKISYIYWEVTCGLLSRQCQLNASFTCMLHINDRCTINALGKIMKGQHRDSFPSHKNDTIIILMKLTVGQTQKNIIQQVCLCVCLSSKYRHINTNTQCRCVHTIQTNHLNISSLWYLTIRAEFPPAGKHLALWR